jgi:hypothetical protein
VITDWARSGMTQEDRVIGEPRRSRAVVVLKMDDKERDPCNEAILERCTATLCWQIPNLGQRLKSLQEERQHDLRLL